MNSSSALPALASQLTQRTLGTSVEGREIVGYFTPGEWPGGRGSTLLIGGMHGDEVATIRLLEEFLSTYAETLPTPVAILPLANPDGYERRTRYNARGVDLNRNCGHGWSPESVEPAGRAPWSEPESVMLRELILAWQPEKIVSLHWALAEIDADGEQSTPLAEAMWAALTPATRGPYRLRVTEIGRGLRRLEQTYSFCPGSLGQWCGFGLEYPDGRRPAMITLELPYDPTVTVRPDPLAEDHLEFLHALWRQDAAGYLQAVGPGVHQMLRAACHFVDEPAASAAT